MIALYWKVAVKVISLFSITQGLLKKVDFTDAFQCLFLCLLR